MDKKITRLNAYLEKKNKRAELLKKIEAIGLKLDAMSKPNYWVELREAKKLEQKQRDFNISSFVKAMVKNQ
jgi:hypothetical protein